MIKDANTMCGYECLISIQQWCRRWRCRLKHLDLSNRTIEARWQILICDQSFDDWCEVCWWVKQFRFQSSWWQVSQRWSSRCERMRPDQQRVRNTPTLSQSQIISAFHISLSLSLSLSLLVCLTHESQHDSFSVHCVLRSPTLIRRSTQLAWRRSFNRLVRATLPHKDFTHIRDRPRVLEERQTYKGQPKIQYQTTFCYVANLLLLSLSHTTTHQGQQRYWAT